MFEAVLETLGESGIRVYCWQEESRDRLEAEGQSLGCLLLRHQVLRHGKIKDLVLGEVPAKRYLKETQIIWSL